jgi:hypothetical protein
VVGWHRVESRYRHSSESRYEDCGILRLAAGYGGIFGNIFTSGEMVDVMDVVDRVDGHGPENENIEH